MSIYSAAGSFFFESWSLTNNWKNLLYYKSPSYLLPLLVLVSSATLNLFTDTYFTSHSLYSSPSPSLPPLNVPISCLCVCVCHCLYVWRHMSLIVSDDITCVVVDDMMPKSLIIIITIIIALLRNK